MKDINTIKSIERALYRKAAEAIEEQKQGTARKLLLDGTQPRSCLIVVEGSQSGKITGHATPYETLRQAESALLKTAKQHLSVKHKDIADRIINFKDLEKISEELDGMPIDETDDMLSYDGEALMIAVGDKSWELFVETEGTSGVATGVDTAGRQTVAFSWPPKENGGWWPADGLLVYYTVGKPTGKKVAAVGEQKVHDMPSEGDGD